MAECLPVGSPGSSTVYLIDVSSFTFRAYHALPPLNTSTGLATNAVHGVSTMIERLLRSEKPRYIAACFDTARETFRREIYPDYKANRDEPDEDLKVQFPLVRRLVAAMGLACFEQAGVEADDVIATLARRYAEEGHDVVIVTGDKDLMQCVNDRVSLLDPVKGKRVRRAQVIEKFGVPPEGVPDVLGLMGDASDNIPGIKGIGPKGASALISHFGSLDAAIERSAEIESLDVRGAKSLRSKLEEGAETARLCRRLATVDYEVPIEVELEDLELHSLVTPELEALAEELEMRNLVPRLRVLSGERGSAVEGVSPIAEPSQGPRAATDADTGAEADRGEADKPKARASRARAGAAARAAGGSGLLPLGPAVVAGAGGKGGRGEATAGEVEALPSWGDWKSPAGRRVHFVIWDLPRAGGPCPVLAVAEAEGAADPAAALVAGGADIRDCLDLYARRGSELVGCDLKRLCREFGARPGASGLDLGVASYLIDASAGDHERADLARRFLGEEPVELDTSEEAAAAALAQVARLEAAIAPVLEQREQAPLYRELEHPLIAILAAMEARGILLDVDALGLMSKDLEKRMADLVGEVYEAAGEEFNILSPVQLREILFSRLGLPTKGIKKTKSGPSTDSDSLAALAPLHPLPRLVLDYRGMAKLKSTYVDALPRLVDDDNRIHTRLNQTVTATGRLSSKDPNLQNIPIRTEEGARIRQTFLASPGKCLVSADYNQIELRVLAHLSCDDNLIQAFMSGLDIHTATSAELFEIDPAAVTAAMRRDAKVVNYGIIYGMGPVRLSRELGIPRAKAGEYIERYFERYSGVKRFYAEMLESARANGYVATLFGRRRYLPDIDSSHGGLRQAAERVATNTPIQGSAADLIKRAMVKLAGALAAEGAPEAELVLQIHDELLLECPQGEVEAVSELVREVMAGAADLVVPIVVDVGSGRNWGQAH